MIRDSDGWWAVAQDIADALHFPSLSQLLGVLDDDKYGVVACQDGNEALADAVCMNNKDRIVVLNEHGVIQAMFHSDIAEAKGFRDWVCEVIDTLGKHAQKK
jgi:prophage antirepressor-like protein